MNKAFQGSTSYMPCIFWILCVVSHASRGLKYLKYSHLVTIFCFLLCYGNLHNFPLNKCFAMKLCAFIPYMQKSAINLDTRNRYIIDLKLVLLVCSKQVFFLVMFFKHGFIAKYLPCFIASFVYLAKRLPKLFSIE